MLIYKTRCGLVVLMDDDVILPGKLSIGSHGYAQLTGVEKNAAVLLHRWLMGCTKGDGKVVDHRNRNRLDCRRENLRVTTWAGNAQNRSTRRHNAYPLPSGRWSARVRLGSKIHNLGAYDTAEEAAEVAARWKREHFTEAA